MRTTGDLHAKWERILEEGGAIEAFSEGVAVPDSFVMVYSHHGGDGACAVWLTGVGSFEDASDALAYLRWIELPTMSDWREASAASGGEVTAEDARAAAAIESLLDELMDSDPSAEELEDVREAWNDLFSASDPGSTIEAWGDIGAVLASPYATETFAEEDLEEVFAPILASVRSGAFWAGDPGQFADAAAALESLERH